MSLQTNPDEELLCRAAQRETFHNVAHQLQCLTRCYNVLYGVTADTASRSNQVNQVSMQQQPNSRAFILRKLKYALRTQYEDCFPLPPPDRCTVLLLFDINEEAFFEIRLKPKAWPVNWPTRLDRGSEDGIDVELYSLAIYMKVLEAFNEEAGIGGGEEPPRASGVVSSSGGGPRSSVVEENRLTRVIVESEVEVIVIDDEEEEEEENNVHANEQQVNRRASADGHVNNGDQQQQQEETEETEEEEAMDDNNMLQEENLAGRPRREGSGSIPSSANSTANNNNRNASNGRNNNNSNGSGSQLPFLNTVKEEPISNNSSSSLTIRRKRPLESTSSSALQNHPLPLPPPPSAAAVARAQRTMARGFAPAASAAVSTSSHLQNSRFRSSAEMTAAADRFYASSAYQSARAHDLLPCPLCPKPITRSDLRDHINTVHLRYHCAWPGCPKVFGYQSSGRNHLREVHGSTAYEQYLQCWD